MSSDMFLFDEPYYTTHLTSSEINISPDDEISTNFFTDQISALSDSSIDSFFQEISDDQNNNTKPATNTTTTTQVSEKVSGFLTDEAQSLTQITHALFSDSPPSNQLETLSLQQQQQQQQQQPHLSNLTSNSSLGNGSFNSDNYSVVSPEVKTEDFHLGFDYPLQLPNSYNSYFLNGGENLLKFMQRSYSSNSFDGNNNNKHGFLFQPNFETFLEVQNFHQALNSPHIENTTQIRRVYSTGDLPKGEMNQQQQKVCSSSPLSGEGNNFMEEANFKVGKYSAEERKERIDRYRAKRTQRNFNKTIKYACRKTLADNRPRIRGRFARNDETGEIPKPSSCFNRYEDDDDLWVDNLQEEDEEGILGRGRAGQYLSNFGATHFQYCGY